MTGIFGGTHLFAGARYFSVTVVGTGGRAVAPLNLIQVELVRQVRAARLDQPVEPDGVAAFMPSAMAEILPLVALVAAPR